MIRGLLPRSLYTGTTTSPSKASKASREYKYQVDLNGFLFLDDAKIRTPATAYRDAKFLDFFWSRLRMRTRSEVEVEVGGSDASFLYESRCGKELNLIRSDDSPIVFHSLSEDSNLNWAGSFHAPLQPHRIFCSESTGRLYHPMPEELKTVLAPWQMSQNNYKDKDKEGLALLRSALVQMHFADSLDHDSLVWKGTRYPLIPCP